MNRFDNYNRLVPPETVPNELETRQNSRENRDESHTINVCQRPQNQPDASRCRSASCCNANEPPRAQETSMLARDRVEYFTGTHHHGYKPPNQMSTTMDQPEETTMDQPEERNA